MTSPVPPAALAAARAAVPFVNQDACRRILEAGAPGIAAAERERLANRTQMVDEVKHELDDAFQFTEPNGSRYGHVSRAWVEVLLATSAASAGAAEAERCAKAADSLKFRLYRPSRNGPGGGMQALDVIPASELLDLLRGQP